MAATDDVRRYWDGKAEALRTDPAATMKDVILRELEIEAIASRLRADDELLDVGTGNAFGAIRWAAQCRRVVAVDYSDGMVAAAREAVRASGRVFCVTHNYTAYPMVRRSGYVAIAMRGTSAPSRMLKDAWKFKFAIWTRL
jgi:precorrin-6B methylase 2